MTIVAELLAGLLVAALLLLAFIHLRPAALAAAIRVVGPVLIGVCGVVAVALGRAGLGAALIAAALGWAGFTLLSHKKPKPKPAERQRAMVRTAALEMELDQETGKLEGMVLAGRNEGKWLGKMGLSELLGLYRELAADAETRQLLEAYLDSRFPVWRKNAKTNVGGGLRGAPGSGPMTKEEAYKVLGLEAGAAAADVREAHRRLMQRLNPDVGRSSFLAARIDEAKNVLLSDHN